MSIASFQNGTIVFSPVRLKSSSMKSSVTSQKYSCPGREQNQLIHVIVEVGVEEASERKRGGVSVAAHRSGGVIRATQLGRGSRQGSERTVSLLDLLHDVVAFACAADGLVLLDVSLAGVYRHGMRVSRHRPVNDGRRASALEEI
jgi:hypothetical protein